MGNYTNLQCKRALYRPPPNVRVTTLATDVRGHNILLSLVQVVLLYKAALGVIYTKYTTFLLFFDVGLFLLLHQQSDNVFQLGTSWNGELWRLLLPQKWRRLPNCPKAATFHHCLLGLQCLAGVFSLTHR